MSRYERNRYFERLCELRAAYENRSVADCSGVIGIADVIAFAERAIGEVSAQVAVGSEDSASTSESADQLN
jgi:hypothetical protein